MGDRTRKTRDPRKVSEAAVLKAVKQLLEARGFRVFRRNTGAFLGEYRSKRTGKLSQRFVRFSEPGMADLWGWCEKWQLRNSENADWCLGKHLEVEIKAPRRRPTVNQERWLECAHKTGCIAFWCDSIDMAEQKLKEWGL